MNKKRVNSWIGPGARALELTGIVQDGNVDPSFRSQVSAFGAAVIMGSLAAAGAFYAKQGSADIPREKLLSAMYCLVADSWQEVTPPEEVLRYICRHDDVRTRELFLDAAIALKLSMNMFDMGKGGKNLDESESAVS